MTLPPFDWWHWPLLVAAIAAGGVGVVAGAAEQQWELLWRVERIPNPA
ncbi:MAG: hypothetical protein WD342_20540 [Verrucomicrobiales bacterium]